MKIEEFGVKEEDFGMKEEEVGVKEEEIGVKGGGIWEEEEEFGVKGEEIGVKGGTGGGEEEFVSIWPFQRRCSVAVPPPQPKLLASGFLLINKWGNRVSFLLIHQK